MNRKSMTRICRPLTRAVVNAYFGISLCLWLSIFAIADDLIAPLESRFQPNSSGVTETTEVPDFQRHISPLLGRLGCNGRACHGSFQGQGGFTLSLFGFDFDADMKALLEKEASRVNTKEPLESKILLKPVDAEMHEGGQRFKKDGWEYWVLRKWIEAGAPKMPASQKTEVQKLVRLEVSTLEMQFVARDETKPIHAIAIWEDGSREDVTSLCRFSSNDTSIAKIDEKGIVTSGDAGDTHIVVSYDKAVVPVSVLRPIGKSGQLQQQIANANTEVDRLVLKKLDKLGIMPSGNATDAEFFRRVSLDLSGTLPTSDQVRAFLNDPATDKRAKMIETILQSPGYAAWWTTFLCDMTGNNDDQLKNFLPIPQFASQHWYHWIYARVAKNVPYDEIVEGIVTAVSREPNESYIEYCEKMTKILDDKSGKSFADRSDLMYYWARQNQRTAEEKAISFAYTFCGVRIQCAQCHKHPFDQWSKQDFDQFERLFDGIVANQNQNINNFLPESKKLAENMMSDLGIAKTLKNKELQDKILGAIKEGKTVPFPELFARAAKSQPNAAKAKKGKNQAASPKKLPTARLLGAEYVDLSTVADPREPLMEWLRRKDNPYFAKAIVNRIWAHYFQSGIVNPPDDLNLANAPSNAELLDTLSNGFIENHYDLKWLHRTILNSATYQRTWQTNETNALDRRNFSHALLRRLPAETAYDALRIALSNTEHAKALCNVESDRAMTLAGASAQNKNGKNGLSSYALTVFGRSIRESNCDCDKSSDPSLLQTVFIRNDADVLNAMNDEHSWLAQVAKEYNLPAPRKSGPNLALAKMEEKKDLRTEEVLDRDVRKYRRQLESLSLQEDIAKKDNTERAIKRVKSELALAEKRLKELTALKQTASREPLVPAAVYLDGPLRLAEHGLSHEDAVKILEEVYLRTLSRKPNESELSRSHNAIAMAENPTNGISDVLWALINSKEFILNH